VTRIKICGLTSVDQASACADLGVEAIGVNFVSSSTRCVDLVTGRAIARHVNSRVLVVAVVADMTIDGMRALRDEVGAGCLQLHGDESADDIRALLPHAYKAVRVAGPDDVARAESMPGDYVLVDAKVHGSLGGTGHALDWSLVAGLARRRRLVLAGGLTVDNVGRAIEQVKPWCVDVASGVESSPGVKDLTKVRQFVDAVRRAG
jgi:phosphoribosylanthranilate isomerase